MTEEIKLRPALFRFIEEFKDRVNVAFDENQNLTDPVAALMFEAFCFGRRVQETGKRIYIVGGVTGAGIEFSTTPYIHETHEDARAECSRLRKRFKKQFFVFSTSKALVDFLDEKPDFSLPQLSRKKQIKQVKPMKQTKPEEPKKLSRREQKYAEFNALQTQRHDIVRRLMIQIELNNRMNGPFCSAGIAVQNYGAVLFGKKPEHLTDWHGYYSRAFGEEALMFLQAHDPEAIQIQEFYLDSEPKVYIDGFRIADGFSVCAWDIPFQTWKEILIVKDGMIYNVPSVEGVGPVPFTEQNKTAYIAMKRINHTQLASMSNRFLKTTYDLALPIEDPDYQEDPGDSHAQCVIDAL